MLDPTIVYGSGEEEEEEEEDESPLIREQPATPINPLNRPLSE